MKIWQEYSSKNYTNITQIVAYKNDTLMIEDYRNGFTRDSTMNVMSVTKSVTSLLIGIAIDNGIIGSADDKVMDYFPPEVYCVKRGEKTIYDVTIKHLLTMTAPFKGKNEPWTKICTSADWTYAALDILGGRSGITNAFRYHTLGTQILLGIIRAASGQNVLAFANENLFTPLGIAPRINAGYGGKDGYFAYLMNKSDHGKVWYTDPSGMPTAGWGLSLSAYEMAQIGRMVLNGGVYNGNRIVSENGISEMTKARVCLGEKFGNQSYGYLWWLPHRTQDVIAAISDGGNVIYINKKENVVIAVTGFFIPRVFDRIELIERSVLTAIR